MFKLVDTNREKEKTFDSRAEAEEKKQDMVSLGASPEQLEIKPAKSDGGDVEVVDHTQGEPEVIEENAEAKEITENVDETLPDESPDIDQDPVDWLPGHFIDTIQGVPTVNRKGYAVIASKYNVSVTAEPVTLASETAFEYAEFRAVATTDDGQEYSGFGSAHVERMDGDDAQLLNELAETRAMKRATAWATGIGLTAVEEML